MEVWREAVSRGRALERFGRGYTGDVEEAASERARRRL